MARRAKHRYRITRPAFVYQMLVRCPSGRTIGASAGQLNALKNSGMLLTGPLVRYWPGLCGSDGELSTHDLLFRGAREETGGGSLL